MSTDHVHVIDKLGGTTKVAELFKIKPPSVSEWRTTGIPEARLMYLRVIRPDLFDDDPGGTQPKAVSQEVS